MSGIDRFMPISDVRERQEVVVHAPAPLAFEVACRFDLQSIPIVHAIFRLRALVLRVPFEGMQGGLVEETEKIGWGRLAFTPDRELVMGSATRPWLGRVTFHPVPPEMFVAFDEPDMVKIVWTIEAEPLAPDRARLVTQTRVVATDPEALRKFKAYWRKFSIGIIAIRWLALRTIRRIAERRYRAGGSVT